MEKNRVLNCSLSQSLTQLMTPWEPKLLLWNNNGNNNNSVSVTMYQYWYYWYTPSVSVIPILILLHQCILTLDSRHLIVSRYISDTPHQCTKVRHIVHTVKLWPHWQSVKLKLHHNHTTDQTSVVWALSHWTVQADCGHNDLKHQRFWQWKHVFYWTPCLHNTQPAHKKVQ